MSKERNDIHLCLLSLSQCEFQDLSAKRFTSGMMKSGELLTVSRAIATGRPAGSAELVSVS